MQTTTATNRTNASTNTLVEGAWNFAYSLLWNNQNFNEVEIELAKNLLRDYFTKSNKPLSKFVQFCERVQLAFQYINRKEGRYASHPLKWLSPHFETGYKGTKDWYAELVQERSYIPIHRFELRVMAEAYLRFVASPTKESYQVGKQGIMHYNTTDILQAFNNAVLNFKYSK